MAYILKVIERGKRLIKIYENGQYRDEVEQYERVLALQPVVKTSVGDTVFDGRLNAKIEDVKAFINSNELQKRQPIDSEFFSWYVSDGLRISVDRADSDHRHGTVFVFWDDDNWVHFGCKDKGGPIGWREFALGQVQLKSMQSLKATDVRIISNYDGFLSYWAWIAEDLKQKFGERKRTGRRPDKTITEAVIEKNTGKKSGEVFESYAKKTGINDDTARENLKRNIRRRKQKDKIS